MKIKLGVIFGGQTVEHEVSIISALQAIENLNKDKYDIVPIYIDKNKVWYTGYPLMEVEFYKDFENNKKYVNKVVLCKNNNSFVLQKTSGLFRKVITELDIVLPVVHGNNIEDGSLAGLLETIGIPYVGSHVIGGAIGQDKVIMKQILASSNIPIVDYIWFYDNEYIEDKDLVLKKINSLGYPVVVKPATLGSSIGITFVKDKKDILDAIETAISYDNKIVVESSVNNLIEVNASVLGNYEFQKVTPLEEVNGEDEILSYSDKYLSGGKCSKSSKGMASASRIIPARISKELTDNIQKTSKEVFKLFNLSGVCRIDYLIDSKTKKYYVNEPNTCPGSLSFYLWKEAGLKYSELLDEMISIAIKEYKNKQKKVMSFETNILAGFNGSKGLKGLKK